MFRTRALHTRIGGAALAASLLLATAACGSGGDDGDGGTAASVVTTSAPAAGGANGGLDATAVFQRIEASSASHDTVEATVTTTAAGQTVVMNLAVRSTPGDLAFRSETDVAGAAMEMVLVDEVLYVRGASFGDTWVRASLDDTTGPLAGLSEILDSATGASDPAGELAALKTSDDFALVGTEDVGGVPTSHYRATVRAADALEALPEELRDQYRKAVSQGLDTYTIDLWLGPDDLPRRTEVAMTVGGQPTVTRVDYMSWGQDVRIVAPPRSETLDLDALAGAAGA